MPKITNSLLNILLAVEEDEYVNTYNTIPNSITSEKVQLDGTFERYSLNDEPDCVLGILL